MPHSTADEPEVPTDVDAPISPDSIADQVEVTTSRLLTGVPDPKVRWHVATAMKDRLPWVMALSAAQLVEDLGSVDAAAKELGVSRQYLTRLMREHDQPGPRKKDLLRETQGYRYGVLLEVYHQIAARAGRLDAYSKLEGNALASKHVLATLDRTAAGWLRRLPERARAELLLELDEARTATGELPERLSLAEQANAMLGISSSRVARNAR